MNYSFIIPVYNRPDEVEELLLSMVEFTSSIPFEVVIIEDGSTVDCKSIIEAFASQLTISYYFKENSGPGDTRNVGMKKAKGDYFIILDSDCILPPHYLSAVDAFLSENYVDCFGGPDAAHESFSTVQKAINSVMTSVLTTGGVRGASEGLDKFQPRSFNMGLSKAAFEKTGGFGKIHPGEDPDLSIRLWKENFETTLIANAFVYHKRRIDWKKFYKQVNKFGKARPILNLRYPEYSKITYWFPTCYSIGLIISLIFALVGFPYFLAFVLLYWLIFFIETFVKTTSFKISCWALWAMQVQFLGYGWGFLYSTFQLKIRKRKPKDAMPEMFFD